MNTRRLLAGLAMSAGVLGLSTGVSADPPPAIGACCLNGGWCVPLTARLCTLARGTYQGDGTRCLPTNPCAAPPACDADWNNDNAVNMQDLFAFLSAYFAGSADVNGDGATNVGDVLEFVNCWFRSR